MCVSFFCVFSFVVREKVFFLLPSVSSHPVFDIYGVQSPRPFKKKTKNKGKKMAKTQKERKTQSSGISSPKERIVASTPKKPKTESGEKSRRVKKGRKLLLLRAIFFGGGRLKKALSPPKAAVFVSNHTPLCAKKKKKKST